MTSQEVIEGLSGSLKVRDALFPLRTDDNDKMVSAYLSDFVRLISDSDIHQNVSTSLSLYQADQVVSRPIFICGYMKSGTTLLTELLDGHENLIVLPGDSWLLHKLDDQERLSAEKIDTVCAHWIKRFVNPTGQRPFWLLGENAGSYKLFEGCLKNWYRQFPEGWTAVIKSVVLAYYEANPVKPSQPLYWVEKTPGNEIRAEEADICFPQAKFIHIVRDPRENFSSLKKLYKSRNWNWEPFALAEQIRKSFDAAVTNLEKFGDSRYLLLSYEKLLKNPKEIITEIVDFLSIPETENLYVPTVNKMPAKSNSMHADRQITGAIQQRSADRWKDVLDAAEQRMILQCWREAGKLGYHWDVNMKDRGRHVVDRLHETIKLKMRRS